MKKGKTLHSTKRNKFLQCATNSGQANFLRQVKVIIIDETSMIPSYELKAIDNYCLRDMMNTDPAFVGKVVLLGDFRQVLPVVPRAPLAAVLDVCLKRSALWNSFHHMNLTQNMRTNENDPGFSRWLLQLGNGSIQSSLGAVHGSRHC